MSQLYATQTSQSNKKYPRLRVTLIGKPTFTTRSLDYVSIRVSVSLFDVGPPFAELPNWRASLANQIRVFVLAICRVSRCALIKRAARRSGKNTCSRVTTFMSRDYRPLEVVRRIRKKKEKKWSARRERRVDLWSVASNPLVNEVASCKNSFRGSLRRLKP